MKAQAWTYEFANEGLFLVVLASTSTAQTAEVQLP